MTTAVIFVPAAGDIAFADMCMAYLLHKGYEFGGLVEGRWEGVLEALEHRAADVVVIARAEHLDPNRKPRIEIVSQAGDVPAGSASKHDNSRPASMRQRRARRI